MKHFLWKSNLNSTTNADGTHHNTVAESPGHCSYLQHLASFSLVRSRIPENSSSCQKKSCKSFQEKYLLLIFESKFLFVVLIQGNFARLFLLEKANCSMICGAGINFWLSTNPLLSRSQSHFSKQSGINLSPQLLILFTKKAYSLKFWRKIYFFEQKSNRKSYFLPEYLWDPRSQVFFGSSSIHFCFSFTILSVANALLSRLALTTPFSLKHFCRARIDS